jgi:hypothetical protein
MKSSYFSLVQRNEFGESSIVVPITMPFSILNGAVPFSCSHPVRSFLTSFFHCPIKGFNVSDNRMIAGKNKKILFIMQVKI